MNTDEVCVKEHLTFLKYINAKFLFYCIVTLTFIAVFTLAWILRKYTFFDKNKCKVPTGSVPTFPYGNFKEVVNQNISLHEFLWKFYNRFKKKAYKYGGLFLFTKPVLLIIDPAVIQSVNKNHKAFKSIYPSKLKLENEQIKKIFSSKILDAFLENYSSSLKGSFPESSQRDECFTALRNHLLESICLIFGFNSSEMVEEINEIIKATTRTSYKYYFSLSYPLFKTHSNKLNSDLVETFLEIMDNRKKNDLKKDDFIQCFVEMYNESTNCSLNEIVNDIFNIFSSTLTHSYSTSLLCLYELSKNDDVQEDVIGEIRRFNKTNVPLTIDNLKEMTYLDAVIKETLRKYPPVPTVSKLCCAEQESGLQLPKDTLVYISPLAIHRDPQNYTKPDEFDPDRFTDDHHYIKPTSFVPFGIDSRSHIDLQLTTLQVKLALVSIFSTLKVSLKDSVPHNLKIDPKLMCLGVCENFTLTFEPL